jgi:hypothetical protein
MKQLAQKDIDRFLSKIAEPSDTGCMEWKCYRNKGGYGTIGIKGKKYLAHRVAWVVVHGNIPEELCVCHTCDNRSCCNPDHLFLGTHQDNDVDRQNKGRGAKGETMGNAKLTETQVREIKSLLRQRYTQESIAAKFNVSRGTISSIRYDKSWKYLSDREE